MGYLQSRAAKDSTGYGQVPPKSFTPGEVPGEGDGLDSARHSTLTTELLTGSGGKADSLRLVAARR
jgi:hypothetical protein